MANFELLGAAGDETRLLIDRASGYSVPLPGHPLLGSAPEVGPKYDVVVKLGDLAVEHGFRLDALPAGTEPRALAHALVSAYATNRAASAPRARPIADRLRPLTAAGAQATYPVRHTADPTVEQLWVLVREAPSGLRVLYQTTRFRTADLNALQWAHLRSLILGEHRWDPTAPRTTVPTTYPTSAFAQPSAKLELTDEAWAEAQAKAAVIGPLADAQTMALADLLLEIAQTDDPPGLRLIPPQVQLYMHKVAMCGPTKAAAVLLRNLEACRTAFDLRAWAWQCAWAIGNRDARGPEQRTPT